MPSRLWQRGIIFVGKDKKSGRRKYVLIAKKTGFMDVWIEDKHFYYNHKESYGPDDDVDIQKAVDNYNAKNGKKKQKITIRKK